jgi:hypothetical protein
MSLKLSKTNAPAYDYLSLSGSMTNPAVCSVIIDKLGGEKVSASTLVHLVAVGAANIDNYSSISITPSTVTTGLTWEVSLNNSTWLPSIAPVMGSCFSADVVVPVYVRVKANNATDTPLATGNYSGEFLITATENPPTP